MHCWIGALDHDLDLVVTLDDATGAIYSAALVEEQGTASSFLRLAGTIARQGQFRALYTDRGSHYFLPTAGSRSSTGRAVSPASILQQAHRCFPGRLTPLGGPRLGARGFVDNAAALPTTPQALQPRQWTFDAL
jgi:hypothetical protein